MVSYRKQNLTMRKILAWFMHYQNRISRYNPKSLTFEAMKYDRLGRLYNTFSPTRRVGGYEVVIHTIMIAGGRYTDPEWKSVLLHELAHAVHSGTRNHNMRFRKNCRRLGVARECRGKTMRG